MSVKIHGKEYITVDERVEMFHELYPNGMIVTTLLKIENNQIMFRATATPDVEKPERYFTGHAEEVVGSSQINKTSAVENCETSAVGRCLGFLNIGLVGSIATADEVSNAIHQQDDTLLPLGKYKGDSWLDVAQKDSQYLDWVANKSEWDEKFKQKAREALSGLEE